MNRQDADRELWSLAAQGSAQAYEQLRQLHRELIRAVLQRHGRDLSHSDLQDLEQEVWIAVWGALPRFEGRSAFTTWLIGVTRHVLYAWLRRKRTNELTLLRFSELETAGAEEAQDRDPLAVVQVNQAVNRLSEREQQVIDLRYFHHLTDQEIATRLQMPVGTVKGRIRTGLLHLRESLRKIYLAEMLNEALQQFTMW